MSAMADEGDAVSLLRGIEARFGARAAVATSFGVEDVVLLQLVVEHAPSARLFTLDTGRLPPETYELMEALRVRLGVTIEVWVPESAAVQRLVSERGTFSFRQSVEERRRCCTIRKVEPLSRALRGADLWLTGLRRDQAESRATVQPVEWDEAHGLFKCSPLAAWSTARVWSFVQERGLPYHRLHDAAYPSIGCAPCTRAVRPWEPARAGRWWWEQDGVKECGLHVAR